ncbi:hypothetical protein N9051_00425 [Akkermansiaceae bacterium]|nr:hypothetical protein [Akkermansiaceae bacterium]
MPCFSHTPSKKEAPKLDVLMSELQDRSEWMEKGNARVMGSLNGTETTVRSPDSISA